MKAKKERVQNREIGRGRDSQNRRRIHPASIKCFDQVVYCSIEQKFIGVFTTQDSII